MRPTTRIASTIVCALALATAQGCGPSSPDTSSTPGTTDTPPAQTGPSPAEGQTAQQWEMPNLTGAVLQDAQDRIQSLTGGAVYFTGSHDLSGRNRNQVVDANWKVCDQNVAPGAALTPASEIDLGVVKLEETCP